MSLPARAAAADPLLGRSLCGYQVEEVLRRATPMTLYRARQLAVEREVAIKVLDLSVAEGKSMTDSFLAEARTAARLKHRGVVEVHDVCREGNYILYSMEHLPGGTLADRVETEGPLRAANVLQLLRDAAEALLYAEREGVVHGRINPTQIHFARNGGLKVINLGMPSSSLDRSPRVEDEPLSQVAYLAPEHFGDGQVDHRSDVYSLGCTLELALTGRVPFLMRSRAEILQAKLKGACAGQSGARRARSLPSRLSAIIARMTAPSPAARFQGFQDLLAAVDRACADAALVPMANAGAADSRRSAGRSRSRRRGRSAVEKAALLGGMGAALVVAFFVARSLLERGAPGANVAREQVKSRARVLPPEVAADGDAAEARLDGELSLAGADLARGQYRVAAAQLERLPLELRSAAAVQDRLDKILETALAELEAAASAGVEEARRGELRHAEQRLRDVASRVPEALRAKVDAAQRALMEARDAFEDQEGPRIAARAWRRVDALELNAAIEVVAAGSVAATGAPLKQSLAGLGEQILSSKRLWDDIQSRGLPEWKDLRQRMVSSASPVASFAAFRTVLLVTAVEAYAERLGREGVERSFHGKVTARGDGHVVIDYDFSSQDQLLDFHVLGGGESPALEAGRLKLRGELRFLEGDPFEGPLSVSLVAPDPDPVSANINVALWTAESCPVTPGLEGDAPMELALQPGGSNGASPERRYLVLGLGYKPADAVAGRFQRLDGHPVICPADVVLLGVRGKALSPGARNCLWGETLLKRVPDSREVEISLERDSLVWRVNKVEYGSLLDAEASRRVRQLLSSAPTGSVTLFTQGGALTLDSLRIAGRLSPGWIATRLRRRAIDELKANVPHIPWQDL